MNTLTKEMLHTFDDVIPKTILGQKKVQSFFSILGEEEEVFGTYLRVVLFVYVFPPLPENQPPIPYPPPQTPLLSWWQERYRFPKETLCQCASLSWNV